MLEIYTPKSWYSIFSFPSLIVDDDGLIYNSDDYYKTFRNPIGKIDYNSGYIYGGDYHKLLQTPIGEIKQDGDVTVVFGEDYHKLTRTPILYITDNKVYSYEEYHKFFSAPSAYIRPDPAKNNSTNPAKNNDTAKSSSAKNDSGEKEEKAPSFIVEMLKMILTVLAVVVIGAYLFVNFMRDFEYAPILITALCVGFVSAFILVKKNDLLMNIFYVELASVVTFWIGIMAIDLPTAHGFAAFGTIFLAPFIIAVMMAIPSIILGFIICSIKKLFKKPD